VAKSKLSDYDYKVLINKNTIETIEYIGENIFRIVTNKLDFNCKILDEKFEIIEEVGHGFDCEMYHSFIYDTEFIQTIK
jgi:hypothetical protein